MGNDYLSEKVSVNINTGTLASIDLLVDNGYYSNRSDFINQALRDAIQRQQWNIDRIEESKRRSSEKKIWFFGMYVLTADEIDSICRSDEQIPVSGYGVLLIEDDVDAKKLFSAIKSIRVRGKIICSSEIKALYALH